MSCVRACVRMCEAYIEAMPVSYFSSSNFYLSKQISTRPNRPLPVQMAGVLAVTVTILSTGGQVSTVSWDHFFVSLNHYYTSLRQEVPPAGDMTHLYRHYTKGITPQEVDGLTAVLKLICRIAEQVRQGSSVSHVSSFREPRVLADHPAPGSYGALKVLNNLEFDWTKLKALKSLNLQSSLEKSCI